ncbi:hypothetical protein [Pseudobutyrivibrio xylanivorans]|uniref:Uncharacterized protein n=1 Tax=Pseudobutyrivibrio xylanivorans TaxID=185007 RepID=A0A5P6VMT5_PSEXY|nr:hypothetical protein [Pseudobutyrivibrio xylanivorans]QFJ53722.1 hypothetical protein FXF36_01975 [Pseudobutyrivibrio xylanivorans]
MGEKKDFKKELSELCKRRENMQDTYNGIKRRIEAMDEEIIRKTKELSIQMNETTTMKPDAKLMDIYSEREAIYRDMQVKQREFYEQVDHEYRKQMKAFDEEEREIKAQMAAEEKEKEGEKKDA